MRRNGVGRRCCIGFGIERVERGQVEGEEGEDGIKGLGCAGWELVWEMVVVLVVVAGQLRSVERGSRGALDTTTPHAPSPHISPHTTSQPDIAQHRKQASFTRFLIL